MGFVKWIYWCSVCQKFSTPFSDKRTAGFMYGIHVLGKDHARISGLNRRDKPRRIETMPVKSKLIKMHGKM